MCAVWKRVVLKEASMGGRRDFDGKEEDVSMESGRGLDGREERSLGGRERSRWEGGRGLNGTRLRKG